MRKCSQCGGRLRRVHRTLFERFSYRPSTSARVAIARSTSRAVFNTASARMPAARNAAPTACPAERARPDRPDAHRLVNLVERLLGGKLYHCRFCRIQFYDRRARAADGRREQAASARKHEPGRTRPMTEPAPPALRLAAEPGDAGTRLDQLLHERLPQYSRSRMQEWIRAGRVLVDGRSAAPPTCSARARPWMWPRPSLPPCAPRPKTFRSRCSTKTTTWWPSTSRPAWWCTPARASIRARW